MKVLPLFKKSEHGFAVPELTPGNNWVLEGIGSATIKLDGIHVKLDNSIVYIRVKEGGQETYIMPKGEAAKVILQAYAKLKWKADGIYEVVGPGIKGNPHQLEEVLMVKVMPIESSLYLPHINNDLVRGRGVTVQAFYDSIKKALSDPKTDAEGLVFHDIGWDQGKFTTHRLATVTRKDFGLSWPPVVLTDAPVPVEPATTSSVHP